MEYRATIRPAQPDDHNPIREIVFNALREFGMEPDPEDTDRDLEDVRVSYIEPGGLFDVLVEMNQVRSDETERIIGTVGLLPLDHPPRACELRKMYLISEARGKGHGRRLLEHALKRACELGFTRVELETVRVLQAAIAMYQRYGFREFTRPEICSRCDIAMALDLEEPVV